MQGELDRVDTLRYMWQKLLGQVAEVQNILMGIQDNFRISLLEKVEVFKSDTTTYVTDYTEVSQHNNPPFSLSISNLNNLSFNI